MMARRALMERTEALETGALAVLAVQALTARTAPMA